MTDLTNQETKDRADALLECREAYYKWNAGRREVLPDWELIFKAGWNSSRSAFAAELVRRLNKEMGIFNEREHSGLMKAIAITRQMAGEK